MYVKELTTEEFDKFTSEFSDKSVYQTSEYASSMNNQSNNTLLIGLIDNDKVIAASLIIVEKRNNFKYAYAPRGFLIDYNDYILLEAFTIELKKYLSKKDIVAIKLSPMIIKNIHNNKKEIIKSNENFDLIYSNLNKLGYYHFGFNNFFESHKPRFEGILNIKTNYLLLFKNIRKEFKTKIRSSEKRGVKIYKGNEEDLSYLINQVSKKYARGERYFRDIYQYFNQNNKVDYYYAKIDTKEFLEISQKFFQEIEQSNNKINSDVIMNADKNSSKLLSKKIESDKLFSRAREQLIKATNMLRDYPEGIIIATALIIRNKDEVVLFMDGFDSNYKVLNAKHLLMWKLIEKYSKLGFSTFNFGGMINPTVENKKYDGLNEFKLSFNANVVEYIGDLELITNNTLYFMYKKSLQFKKILKK